MKVDLDEAAISEQLSHYMDDPLVASSFQEMVSDRFLLAFFLMSVSQAEEMGEAGVSAIREEEISQLIQDIDRQEREEAGHKELSRELAVDHFSEFFDAGRYKYASQVTGQEYYRVVLEQNRAHLKERGAYSRLNLYLTTTFGYEIMVGLFYGAAVEAIANSDLPDDLKHPIVKQFRRILGEEETHLEIATQHNALLAANRSQLSDRTNFLLEKLERLSEEEYVWAAELSMKEIVRMVGRYSAGPQYRAEIESASVEQT